MMKRIFSLPATRYPLRSKRGFSLVETLVATAIIVMATVGPLNLAGQSLAQANYIKDQIVATFLAQEGLEIMRNIRDVQQPVGSMAVIDSYATSCSFISNSGCMVSGTKLLIDDSTYGVEACTGSSGCPYLNFNPESSIYNYDTSASIGTTIYKRTITVEKIVDGKEYRIHSVVSWERGYGPRSIELIENLFSRTW